MVATFTGTIYTGPVVLGDNLAVGIAQGRFPKIYFQLHWPGCLDLCSP